MVKRVLFAFPDYSHTCLRSIKLFVNQGFEVDIAIAYHFKWIPFFFKWMPNNSLKKLYKRREIVEELLHNAPPKTISFKQLSLIQFLKSFYKGYFVRKRPFYNILKDMIQEDLCSTLNYQRYSILYLFDTVAYLFQEEAKKEGLKTILECRGPHFYFSQNLRLQLLATKRNEVAQKYVPENENDEWWFRKLTSEPEMADYLICYSDFHAKQYVDYSSKQLHDIFILPLPSTISKSKVIKVNKKNTVSFYFAGNVTSIKGIDQLLAAWKVVQSNLKNNQKATLHIYGLCVESTYLPEFKSVSSINFHGKLMHSDLMESIKQHDVCIFPSLLDSYGFALQEAIQLNTPIISNYTSGASFLYEHNLHGFKCSDSYAIEELATYINRFIESPSLVEQFSTAMADLPNYDESYMNHVGQKNIQNLFTEIGE